MSTVPLRATSYLKDNKPMRASTTSGMARGSVIENVSPLADDEGETARFQRCIVLEIRKRRPASLAERIAQFHRLRHALLQADAACLGQVYGLTAQRVDVLQTRMDGVTHP